MMRWARRVLHNWPLKLAAVVLATLLYVGLVVSQTTSVFPGIVPIETARQSSDVMVLSDLGSVRGIRYIAPEDLGLRIDASSFVAAVDLGDLEVTGAPVSVSVHVTAVDPRVQVLDFEPRAITITIDRVISRTVPIEAILGDVPAGLQVGDPMLDVTTAEVRGPSTVVDRVDHAEARVPIDPSGIDVDRDIDLVPVDVGGISLAPVDVSPRAVHVRLAVFTDRRTRTLPVTPTVAGTPAAGFEVISVVVEPLVVSVEGDANDLANLDTADTEPISVSGASSDIVQSVALRLPTGVQAIGDGTVIVTVRIRPVTGTRTFQAGVVVVGARADRTYALSTDRVLVTIGGSVADLDRLSGATLTVTLDVTGLDTGQHEVRVTANLQTGLTLVGASPDPIIVTIADPAASPTPS
jgi:YbbR domain-containing protein